MESDHIYNSLYMVFVLTGMGGEVPFPWKRNKKLEKLLIRGGKRLKGTVKVSGAKNAAVAIH